MKIAFLIGVNDVGGAEYVSYHHVMMAYRNGIDVIVLSGTTGKFYDLIRNAGVRIEVVTMNPAPHIISRLLQGCDTVFNCNFFAIAPLVIELKKRLEFKYLTIIHSNINWVYDQLAKYDDHTDVYYAIHQKIVDRFVGYGYMKRNKFSVIPNCVDTDLIGSFSGEREKTRLKLGYKKNDFVIGMISRIAADKNILDALKILLKLPESINARLLIIGGAASTIQSRNYYDRVKRLARTIGGGKLLSRVQITGNLNTNEVYRTMQAFDIGLNCSPSEGLPIALLEMMGAGIACVMPSVGDIPDVLTGRGIVVPIRQRLEIKEILSEPCYTMAEINEFALSIEYLFKNRNDLSRLGNVASKYVNEFRSLKFQEKLFLNFLDMDKKTKTSPSPSKGGEKQGSKGEEAKETQLIASVPEFPIVSVLMPIRDGNEEWIEKAVASIVFQDYKGDIELIIINHDCRLSLTQAIDRIEEDVRKSVVKGDAPGAEIKIIKIADANLQFSEALDLGIENCTGGIIVRMDCDDIAEPNLVSKLSDFMQANANIDVCGVQVHFFGAKEMDTHHPAIITRKSAHEMPGAWFINHPGVAIRKAALIAVGGYGKTKTGFAEDYHLWCKILKAGGVIANLPDVLMDYRCYHKGWRYPDGYVQFLDKEKAGLK